MITFFASVAFMVYGVIDTLIPLWGEASYAGTTYTQLLLTQPKLANLFWHDSVLYGSAIFLVPAMVAILAWFEISKGSKLAWGLTALWSIGLFVSALIAHVSIGDTNFSHVGYAAILIIFLFVGLAVSAKPVFSSGTKGLPI